MIKGVKPTTGLKPSYQTSGYIAGRGSPSLKENGGNYATNYLASLKNSTKNLPRKSLKDVNLNSNSHFRLLPEHFLSFCAVLFSSHSRSLSLMC